MKRKYRRTIWFASYEKNTYIDVGYIYNKSRGNPDDVISIQIVGVEHDVSFNCRLDEAVCIAAGLNKVATQMLVGQLPMGHGTRME